MNNVSIVVKNSKCLNENPNCKNEHEFVPIGNGKYFEMKCTENEECNYCTTGKYCDSREFCECECHDAEYQGYEKQ